MSEFQSPGRRPSGRKRSPSPRPRSAFVQKAIVVGGTAAVVVVLGLLLMFVWSFFGPKAWAVGKAQQAVLHFANTQHGSFSKTKAFLDERGVWHVSGFVNISTHLGYRETYQYQCTVQPDGLVSLSLNRVAQASPRSRVRALIKNCGFSPFRVE